MIVSQGVVTYIIYEINKFYPHFKYEETEVQRS